MLRDSIIHSAEMPANLPGPPLPLFNTPILLRRNLRGSSVRGLRDSAGVRGRRRHRDEGRADGGDTGGQLATAFRLIRVSTRGGRSINRADMTCHNLG
jgi:hypothetical protein